VWPSGTAESRKMRRPDYSTRRRNSAREGRERCPVVPPGTPRGSVVPKYGVGPHGAMGGEGPNGQLWVQTRMARSLR